MKLFLLAAVLCGVAFTQTPNPDAVCATCHREIAASYAKTTMARGSGAALDGASGIVPGGFRHAASGVDYRVFLRESSLYLSFDRDATSTKAALHGERKLLYFVGSNQRGRTFLYQQGGQWFEAPINFYSKKAVWDMAPNFGSVTTMPTPLPVDANCLHCHATNVATAEPEARNRFSAAPFAQAGIGCAACHGDPAAHLAANGHGPIVNPGKLSPAKRDSACLNCHLEGDAAVFRANTSPAAFRPGDDLDRYAVYFVKASAQAGGGRAASQWEALLRSACKSGVDGKPGAGNALTCTTCHDPHSSPIRQPSASRFIAPNALPATRVMLWQSSTTQSSGTAPPAICPPATRSTSPTINRRTTTSSATQPRPTSALRHCLRRQNLSPSAKRP